MSTGTLNPRDLIDVFEGFLEAEEIPVPRMPAGLRGFLDGNLNARTELTEEQADDAMSEHLDALFERMGAAAPDGFYFGAHPGDGADFGFWREEG